MFLRLLSKNLPLARAPIVLSLLGATMQQCAAGRVFSHWAAVPAAPPDKILGLSEAFKVENKLSVILYFYALIYCYFQVDTAPLKVDLGVGAYRDDNGKPYVLESVREAERRILSRHMDHE